MCTTCIECVRRCVRWCKNTPVEKMHVYIYLHSYAYAYICTQKRMRIHDTVHTLKH